MKFVFKIVRYFLVALLAIVLVSVGIDAADNYDNISESLIGKIIFGEEEGPCPSDMAYVPTENGGFCIDKYEASPGDDCPALETMSQNDTRSNLDLGTCIPVSVAGVKPWRYISQSQAMTACSKAGKRLPSSQEWFEASLGTPDKNAAWGMNDCQVDSNWSEQPGDCGSGADCVSSYGAYDMIGNVWEWVKGEVSEGILDGAELPEAGFINEVNSAGMVIATTDDPDQNFNEDYLWIKKNGNRGIARGGYWKNGLEAGVYSIYMVSPSSFAGDGVGFRCVK